MTRYSNGHGQVATKQFLKARRAEDRFLWQQVEETHAYRQQHPEYLRTVTADEFLALTEDAEDPA